MKKWIAMLTALVLCFGMTALAGCEDPLEPATAEELLAAEVNLEEGLTLNFSLTADGISTLIPNIPGMKWSAYAVASDPAPAAEFASSGSIKLKGTENALTADLVAQATDQDGETGSVTAYVRTDADSAKLYYALGEETEYTLIEQALDAVPEENNSVYMKVLETIFGQLDLSGADSSALLPYCGTPEIVEREYHMSVDLGRMIRDKSTAAISAVKLLIAMVPEDATVGSLYADETVKELILSALEDVTAADVKALLEEVLTAAGYDILLPGAGDKTVAEYLEGLMLIELPTEDSEIAMKISDFPIGAYVAQLGEKVVPALDLVGTMLSSLKSTVNLVYNADRKPVSASFTVTLMNASVSGTVAIDYNAPSFQDVSKLTVKAPGADL